MGHLDNRQLARKLIDMKLLVTQLALVLLFVAVISKPVKEKRYATGYAYSEPGERHTYHNHEFLAPDLSSIKEVEAVGFTHHGSGVIDDDDHHSRTSQAGFLFDGARKFPYYGYQLDYGDQHQTTIYPLATRGAHTHHPHFGTDLIGLHASFPGVFAGGRVPLDDLRVTPFGESYYGVQWYGARTPDTELSYSGFLVEGTGPVRPGRAHYPLYGSHEGLHSSYPGFAPGIMEYDRVELNSFADKYNSEIIGGGYGPHGANEAWKKHFLHKRSTGGFSINLNTFSNGMIEDSSFDELITGYKGDGEAILEGGYGGKGFGWGDDADLGAFLGEDKGWGHYDGEGLGRGHYGSEDLVGYKKQLLEVPKVNKFRIERPYPVEQPKPVDRPYPVEVKTPVDRLYPYEVQKPYPEPVRYPIRVEIPVSEPYPVVVPKPVEHPYPVVVEKQVPISEPYPFKVRVPVEQSYSVEVKVPIMERYPVAFEVPVDKPYPVYIEKEIPVPEPYPVRVKVPVPVYVPKPYPVEVKVPVHEPYPVEVRVPIPDPYPVTVEKDIPVPEPYPVEKRIPVDELYPVEVDVPVYHPYAFPVPKPYPVQKTISISEPYPVPKFVPYPVEKTIAVSRERPYPVPVAKPYPVPVKVGKGRF